MVTEEPTRATIDKMAEEWVGVVLDDWVLDALGLSEYFEYENESTIQLLYDRLQDIVVTVSFKEDR
jgi:hypothetical protein